MASCTDKYTDGMFFNRVNSKDGFAISECKDIKMKRVFEFLVLILYLKKPTQVTIIVGITIFGHIGSKEN